MLSCAVLLLFIVRKTDQQSVLSVLGRVRQLTGRRVRIKVVQQLTCLTLGRPNGLAYSIGELLNTPLDFIVVCKIGT